MISFKFVGVFLFLVALVDFDPETFFEQMKPYFMIFPHYTLTKCVHNLYTASLMSVLCLEQCDVVPGCTMEWMCKSNQMCCGIE